MSTLGRRDMLQSNNSTGFKGVNYNRQLKKYEASYTMHGKKIYLGVFDDVLDAGVAASDYRLAHAEEIAQAREEERCKRSESIRRHRATQTAAERSEQSRRGALERVRRKRQAA